MLKQILISFVAGMAAVTAAADTPVYLDPSRDIEERVEDALSRMTTAEKVAILRCPVEVLISRCGPAWNPWPVDNRRPPRYPSRSALG